PHDTARSETARGEAAHVETARSEPTRTEPARTAAAVPAGDALPPPPPGARPGVLGVLPANVSLATPPHTPAPPPAARPPPGGDGGSFKLAPIQTRTRPSGASAW